MRIKSPVFVGRHEELALLERWLHDATGGHPRFVVIGGEAGVGKSRLVDEFSRVAAEEGTRWLIGAAADYGAGGLPFGPVVEALRPLATARGSARIGVASGGGRGELARLLPELATPVPAGPAQPATDPSTVADTGELPQLRIFDLLLGLLDEVARDRPTVLALEDLHWTDASTREFLSFLARNLGSMPLLVVGTYRSDDLDRRHPLRRYLTELRRAGRIEHVELARLGRDELAEQVRAIRDGQVDDAVIDELFQRSQGNPFFAEELVAAGGRSGGMGDEAIGALPSSLREVLLARLDRLSDDGRSLLAAAAVLGTASEEMLTDVSGLAEDELLAALREAVDSGVLEPEGQEAPGYRFRHALLREAIYNDLLRGERIRLHQRAAANLERAGRPPSPDVPPDGQDAGHLAQLAYHWRRAERPAEALVAAWRAGRAAWTSHAYPEASLHYEHVLDLWPAAGEPAQLLSADGGPVDRLLVAEHAAIAADIAGEFSRAGKLWQVAIDELDEEAQPGRAARIYAEQMQTLVDAGDAPAAEAARQRAVALVERGASPDVRAEILVSASNHLLAAEDDVLPLAQAALAAAEEADRPDLRAWAHVQVGRHSSFLGDVESGMANFAAARRLAQDHRLELIVASADKERAIILECSARFEEALEALESARTMHARLGLDRFAKHDLALIGQTLHRLGRWAQAEAALDEALRLPPPPWAHVVRAYLLVGLGRWEEAQRALDFAWESVEKSDSSASYGPYYSAQAEMAIWQGRPADALAAVTTAFTQVLDPRWCSELVRLGVRAAADIALSADAGKQVDQRESALRQADEGLARAREVLAVSTAEQSVYLPEVVAGLLTTEAEVGRARGAPDPTAWAKAADAWLALKEPYPAAYALFRQAEAELAGGGGRTAAETPLRRSVELCREMGAAPLLEMAEALARRARIDVGRPPPAAAGEARTVGDYGLTERERDVLALLAEGRSDRQIAEELFISPKTASVHVSNIKGKLGVEHRIEAAAIGLRLGLGDGGRRLHNGDR